MAEPPQALHIRGCGVIAWIVFLMAQLLISYRIAVLFLPCHVESSHGSLPCIMSVIQMSHELPSSQPRVSQRSSLCDLLSIQF